MSKTKPPPVKETPILFSTPMVRAILDGRKTQTRRAVDEQWSGRLGLASASLARYFPARSPYGDRGDDLWVKETWRTSKSLDDVKPTNLRAGAAIEYRAGGNNVHGYCAAGMPGMGRWRPSIFMCRWMSRLTLEITGLRVERLQDIGEADAQAEGVERLSHGFRDYSGKLDVQFGQATSSYLTLWDAINGSGSWAANPWVWVVEFRRKNL